MALLVISVLSRLVGHRLIEASDYYVLMPLPQWLLIEQRVVQVGKQAALAG